MRRRCVLVVDDDPDQGVTLGLLLREAGHRVEAATNALYALTIAAEFTAEFVFLDIGLPAMNGYEVLARLKKRCPQARFYAITGRTETETRAKAMAAGFDGYFKKPLDVAAIKELLQH